LELNKFINKLYIKKSTVGIDFVSKTLHINNKTVRL